MSFDVYFYTIFVDTHNTEGKSIFRFFSFLLNRAFVFLTSHTLTTNQTRVSRDFANIYFSRLIIRIIVLIRRSYALIKLIFLLHHARIFNLKIEIGRWAAKRSECVDVVRSGMSGCGSHMWIVNMEKNSNSNLKNFKTTSVMMITGCWKMKEKKNQKSFLSPLTKKSSFWHWNSIRYVRVLRTLSIITAVWSVNKF